MRRPAALGRPHRTEITHDIKGEHPMTTYTSRRLRRAGLAAVLGIAALGGSAAASSGDGDDLRLWGWASSAAEDAALTSLLESYTAESGATVTFEPQPEYDTALQASLVGGDPPDIFYINSDKLPDLAAAGAIQPVPEGAITDPDDVYPSLRAAFSYDDVWYCPPKDFSTLALVYNTAALAEAGVEPPTTMEELAAAAAALTNDQHVGLGLGPALDRAGVFLLAEGGYIVSEDATEMTLDSDANRAALQFLADLFAAGHADTPANLEAGWTGEALGLGKAAMVIEGNWIVNYLAESFPDLEYGVVEIPAGAAGNATYAFTVCYGVAAEAADAAASWAAIDFLTGPVGAAEWTKDFVVMPARESLRDGWVEANPELGAFVAGADYARAFSFQPGFGDVIGEFNSQFEQLISGGITVDELIANVTDAGNSVL